MNKVNMASAIIRNLVYLTEHLSNLDLVLIHLLQENILCNYETEEIMNQARSLNQNLRLLELIEKKDFLRIKNVVLQILRDTGNCHCADVIEGKPIDEVECKRFKVLSNKWWPEEKTLIESFYERKTNESLFVDELNKNISQSENGMTVINQKVAVSGLGGVGKTTLAKWFAIHFQNNYDYIIWIDCGEGSLIESFTNLARELNVKNRNELNLKNMAKSCFALFCNANCLFVFDNAECYAGNEGIRDVLPSNKNFHTIITSRNREWGNETGLGKIAEFQLDAFLNHESVDFLKKNTKDFLWEEEDDLKLLAELLGNLPLALQIAVATVNRQKTPISDYIRRIRKTDSLIHSNFDDYEKTINKTMKISLDCIKNHEGENGITAHNILLNFGYLRPDDIRADFFEKIEEKMDVEIEIAIELLEKYSLVTSMMFYGDNDKINKFVSIHRLLQQVIRFNGKDIEDKTITKILKCDGNLNYKLIPFSFASDQVKTAFPEIKAQLIDQFELKELMRQRRFQEAVDLAIIIKNTLTTLPSLYNYGVCLNYNGERQDALEVFTNIYDRIDPQKQKNVKLEEFGLLKLENDPTKCLAAGQIYFIYWRKKKPLRFLHETLKQQNRFEIQYTYNGLLEIINSVQFFDIHDFFLKCDGRLIVVELRNENFGKQIELKECRIYEKVPFSKDLKVLNLFDTVFVNIKGKAYEIFDLGCAFNLAKLNSLKCGYSVAEIRKARLMSLCLGELSSIENLKLSRGCQISINGTKISPKTLSITNPAFLCNGVTINKVFVNDVIDFRQISNLELQTSSGKSFVLDMCDAVDVDNVTLTNCEVINWKTAKWKINTLTIDRLPPEESLIEVHHVDIQESVDFACIPQSVQILTLNDSTEISENSKCGLTNLKCLNIHDVIPDLIFNRLSYCPNLVAFELSTFLKELQLNLDILPKTVKHIKLKNGLSDISVLNHGMRRIETLCLQGFSFSTIESILQGLFPLHPKILIFTCEDITEPKLRTLVSLAIKSTNEALTDDRMCKKLIFGKVQWDSFDKSNIGKFFDKESAYYVFENERGVFLEAEVFNEKLNIDNLF